LLQAGGGDICEGKHGPAVFGATASSRFRVRSAANVLVDAVALAVVSKVRELAKNIVGARVGVFVEVARFCVLASGRGCLF
jgi:hypothetical protein